MQHIEAVDGRVLPAKQYYECTQAYFSRRHFFMSPSELGCTLSHIKALEAFVSSGQPYGLILEDDIIGGDEDINKIQDIAARLEPNSVLLCGGQEGIGSRRYQYGKLVTEWVFQVAPASYRAMLRACCYVVTQHSAKAILSFQRRHLELADEWWLLLSESDVRLYYSNILQHPLLLNESHLEPEREISRKQSFAERYLSFNLFRRWRLKISRKKALLFFRLQGYQKLS